MSWVYLIIAGLFETIWAVELKSCEGFKITFPFVCVISSLILSLFFLTLAIKEIPIGTAYAVWTGIGILGVTICGMLFFHETISVIRILCLSLIFLGIVGLNLYENK